MIFELFSNPLFFLLWMVTLIIALSVHEFSHAYVADQLGDPTPRSRGRLTLNPLSHFDPIGTTMILLIGFGWGKPVPVNPVQLRGGVRGMAYVALAGPVSNFILATMAGLLIRFGLVSTDHLIYVLCSYFIGMNVGLGLFNLLPFGPLDGYKIAVGFLPPRWSWGLVQMQRSGQMIWFTLIALFAFQAIYPRFLALFWRIVVGA